MILSSLTEGSSTQYAINIKNAQNRNALICQTNAPWQTCVVNFATSCIVHIRWLVPYKWGAETVEKGNCGLEGVGMIIDHPRKGDCSEATQGSAGRQR